MKYTLLIRRAMLLATSCAVLQHGGFVLAAQGEMAAPMVGTRPAMNTLTPQPVVAALRDAASGGASASAVSLAPGASGS